MARKPTVIEGETILDPAPAVYIDEPSALRVMLEHQKSSAMSKAEMLIAESKGVATDAKNFREQLCDDFKRKMNEINGNEEVNLDERRKRIANQDRIINATTAAIGQLDEVTISERDGFYLDGLSDAMKPFDEARGPLVWADTLHNTDTDIEVQKLLDAENASGDNQGQTSNEV